MKSDPNKTPPPPPLPDVKEDPDNQKPLLFEGRAILNTIKLAKLALFVNPPALLEFTTKLYL